MNEAYASDYASNTSDYGSDDTSDCELDNNILDDTWINNIEKEENLYNRFYKESNDAINIFFVYINNSNEIYHIKKDNINLDNNVLDKLTLIYLLKKYRIYNNTKHKIISIIQYNIDLEPKELPCYLKKQEDYNFLYIKSKIVEIKWDDTINLFKDLYSLYILFYESNHTKKNETKKVIIRSKRKLKRTTTRKKT